MDNLVEQVVKRKKDSKYFIRLISYILLAILIPGTFVVLGIATPHRYFVVIAFFISLFCIYGLWFFISSLKIDYEYATLGDVLRVDKIIAKRNRKKVVKIHLKTVEDLFKYSDGEMSKRKFNKIYNVGAEDYSDDNYVIVFNNEARGKQAVVFSPNEKILNAIRPYLSREIVKKIF